MAEQAREFRLRPEAVELLLKAVEGKGDRDGVIAVARSNDGLELSFGREHKTFDEAGRDAERYQAALQQLTDRGLIASETGERWHVTTEGRAKAEELLSFGQQSLEWDG